MASEKVTKMILYVDLKCPCCYKKVKKVLCKFPQIRDQVFDEDKNRVLITVVCCDPERIRDKLCCKGGKAIQSIEIVENKPKPPEKPKPPVEKPKEVEKTPVVEKKPSDGPKSEPKPPPVVVPVPVSAPKPKVDPPKPNPPKVDPPKPDPPKADPPKKPEPAPAPAPAPMPPVVVPQPEPPKVPEYPQQPFCPPQYPVSVCCQECYEGRDGGPCHFGYGRPVPPPPGPCYDGYGYQYGGNRPCYVSRCDYYFSEENPQGCSIM